MILSPCRGDIYSDRSTSPLRRKVTLLLLSCYLTSSLCVSSPHFSSDTYRDLQADSSFYVFLPTSFGSVPSCKRSLWGSWWTLGFVLFKCDHSYSHCPKGGGKLSVMPDVSAAVGFMLFLSVADQRNNSATVFFHLFAQILKILNVLLWIIHLLNHWRHFLY